MAEFEVFINDGDLHDFINSQPGTAETLQEYCSAIQARAQANAAGYRSGIWHEYGSKKAANPGNGKWVDRGRTYPTKGNTPARYASNVQKRGGVQVGLVYTANHAAQKENMQHNTLLKSI